jgi:hypothetical protein
MVSHITIFQTKPDRGGKKVNKEEWKPNAITIGKIRKQCNKTLDETQKKNLNY